MKLTIKGECEKDDTKCPLNDDGFCKLDDTVIHLSDIDILDVFDEDDDDDQEYTLYDTDLWMDTCDLESWTEELDELEALEEMGQLNWSQIIKV